MISTQNLNIRRFSDRDFENLRTLEADPEVMRFTGPGRVQSTAESKVNLVRFLEPMGMRGIGELKIYPQKYLWDFSCLSLMPKGILSSVLCLFAQAGEGDLLPRQREH